VVFKKDKTKPLDKANTMQTPMHCCMGAPYVELSAQVDALQMKQGFLL
jgi:hypothetical protein